MNKNKAAGGSVVDLESRRARRSAQRDSPEFVEAMRRHPSAYQRDELHS
jgi:hypothetical protein